MSDVEHLKWIISTTTDAVNTACRENGVTELDSPWLTETALRDKVKELVTRITQRRLAALQERGDE